MAKTGEKQKSGATSYASAMDKLRDELARCAGDGAIQAVGEYLTGYLMEHPEAEAAMLNREKSLDGAWLVVVAAARKQMKNGCAALDDETVFGIVRGYYGLKATEPEGEGSTPSDALRAPAPSPREPEGENADAREPVTVSPLSTLHSPLSTPESLSSKSAGESPSADLFDLDDLLGV